MQIFFQNHYQNKSCSLIRQTSSSYNCTNFDDNIENIISENTNNKLEISTVFLDEKNFVFYTFDIIRDFEKPCNIHDVNQIIEDKLIFIKKEYGQHGQKLFSIIDMILIDGQPSKYLVNRSGMIFFRLSFVFLTINVLNDFSLKCNKALTNQTLQIFPNSLHTVDFIKKTLNKDSFFLLYIYEDFTKLIQIRNGFFADIQHINIGAQMLRSIYKDNNIAHLFFAKKEDLTNSPLVKDIVYQSVDFFTQMLAKRLKDHIGIENDIILISSLTQNIFFQEQFNKWYNDLINGFILPFSYSQSLKDYNRKRSPEQIDILTYLNSLESINESIW